VAAELVGEYQQKLFDLIKTHIDQAGRPPDFSGFVEELVDFGFAHPDGPATVMLNIGEPHYLDQTLLALSEMRRYLTDIRTQLKAARSVEVSESNMSMLIFSFTLMLVNFVGAREFHASSLGFPPESPAYRQWVKKALRSTFQPVLDVMMAGHPADSHIIIPKDAPNLISNLPPLANAVSGKPTKGDLSRQKILDAARAVFIRKPYDSASMRMIGRQGGFDFTLIHHYFPTKKSLAEAVVNRVFSDFFQTSSNWWMVFASLETERPVSLYQGMSLYFERLLTYFFDHPAAPAMLMQNIAQAHTMAKLPFFDYFFRFLAGIFERLQTLLSLGAPEEEIRIWQYCLVTLIANCVGAPDYPARIFNLTPGGSGYRQWVKEGVMLVFYPGLRRILPANEALNRQISH